MKQHFTLFVILSFLTISMFCQAQQLGNDTIPVKTEIYLVRKKKETILGIAAKLKLDLQTISYLNDTMPVDKVLQPGQSIIIPVNPMTEKQNIAAFKNSGATQIDTIAIPQVAKVPGQTAAMTVDTELIQNKILLADATLDLNRALLQGIQASLDSLNVNDKVLIDEKNISATIHHMQRQRDKAMLTPVLLHMQDSLKNEIKREENERASYLNMITPKAIELVKPDTALPVTAVIKDTVTQVPVSMRNDTQFVMPVKTEAVEVIPVKADSTAHRPVALTTDTPEPVHIRPVIEAIRQQEAAPVQPIMHWEAAKAIYYNDDTAAAVNPLKSAADSAAYTPGPNKVNNEPLAAMSDSARIIRAQYFYTKALKAGNEKNYKTATEYLKKAIDISPLYYDAWFALGEADAHLGFYTKAMNEFGRCKALDSSNANLYYKMGMVQLKLKQKTEAFADFNKALKRDSNYIPAIISRAGEYADRNQLRTAIREYSRVLRLDPSYHTVYKSKGMAEYSLKNYAAAIDDFTRFLIFSETDGSVYYYRGLAKLKQSDLMDACTDLSVSARLGYPAALRALEANCK